MIACQTVKSAPHRPQIKDCNRLKHVRERTANSCPNSFLVAQNPLF
ncbi:hypothetical protein TR2A62_1241 [Thalassobium sp. R2A62]|nr:hypothetical protein TR2A62_1241 [Thalassobium sp. R2A62]